MGLRKFRVTRRVALLFVTAALLVGSTALIAGQPTDCSLVKNAEASADLARRCVLWKIVQSCFEPSVSNYCSTCERPIIGTPCSVSDECLRTEVWGENEQFVAFRDHFKTCGCPQDFVHGLVIPRHPCTGGEDRRTVSDPQLAGAWAFAWKSATTKISNPEEILLVANPMSLRSQDQLHIHVVRPAPGARENLLALVGDGIKATKVTSNFRAIGSKIADLNDVWSAAAKAAKRGKIREYGIAVIRDGKEYVVAAVAADTPVGVSPEGALALYECPTRRPIHSSPVAPGH